MFGSAQADRYIEAFLDTLDLIAEFPHMARPRHDIEPPARVHTHRSHIIIHDIDERGGVLIVRIRQVLEDWRNLSGIAEP